MTDNKKVLKVLNGFLELSPSERQIFVSEISDYLNQTSFRQSVSENEVKVKLQSSLGPTNDRNCPCCGKG